jgi:hypothetical protein
MRKCAVFIPVRAQSSMNLLLSLLQLLLACQRIDAFSTTRWSSSTSKSSTTATTLGPSALYASSSNKNLQKYSSLPPGLSPFEKSVAKCLDVQGSFRKLAAPAFEQAIRDGATLLELEFPPLIGGDLSKTNFDDFDNVQELNANSDWCAQFLPTLAGSGAGSSTGSKRDIWFILPDDKECELSKKEWTGQRFRKAAKFTSIRAATCATAGTNNLALAWGSSIASTFDKLKGGDGILADSSTLDDLSDNAATSTKTTERLHFVCQPGSGGPVEDWINVERLHNAASSSLLSSSSPPDNKKAIITCVLNGALDKVRDGYYASVFFPALAATVPFYKQFQPIFFLKPVSDKGLYGWLYRVYPEPWQVILQTARPVRKGDETVMTVENTVALVSEERPSYQEAVQAMLTAALKIQKQ